jgi:hypothetical protein
VINFRVQVSNGKVDWTVRRETIYGQAYDVSSFYATVDVLNREWPVIEEWEWHETFPHPQKGTGNPNWVFF